MKGELIRWLRTAEGVGTLILASLALSSLVTHAIDAMILAHDTQLALVRQIEENKAANARQDREIELHRDAAKLEVMEIEGDLGVLRTAMIQSLAWQERASGPLHITPPVIPQKLFDPMILPPPMIRGPGSPGPESITIAGSPAP